MANHKSAIKRIRQTAHRNERNTATRSRLRSQIKNFRKAVEAGEKEQVGKLLGPTVSLVDKAAQKGVLHKKKAARVKSSLTIAANKIASTE